MAENRCLCGKTAIVLEEIDPEIGVCHCRMCRKWSGGPYLNIKHAGQLKIIGIENVSIYDSSEWAERGFCKNCGTHLFYRLKNNEEAYLPAGLLEDDKGLVLDHQIFIDEKPSYYSFAQKTQDMTAAQVFAMFASAEQT